MGRRVWSDPEILELSNRFVLAADEVWRLQRDEEPECRFFRRSVRGNEEPSRGTLQGTYVLAPGGQLLARRNSGNPRAIAEMLRKALERWDELDDAQRTLADPASVAPGFRWEDSYPEGGLVLRRTARDLPADGDSSTEPTGRFNRDAIWFHRGELEDWLPESLEPGATRELPEALVHRLSCLALVDNVRGQTIPYHPEDDLGSELRTEVRAVDGDRITLAILGRTRVESPGSWAYEDENNWKPRPEQSWPHGISTEVTGRAVYDRARACFVEFELLALGERHGRTIMQARQSTDPSPIGFVCELAPPTWRVAPTFINVYDVDWVREPGR